MILERGLPEYFSQSLKRQPKVLDNAYNLKLQKPVSGAFIFLARNLLKSMLRKA